MKSKIFISYSRRDINRARQIVSKITDKTGVIPWIDLDGIESGKQFLEVIVSAIDTCEILVCLLSQNSLRSSYVRKEITYAVNTGKILFLYEIERVEIPDWLWALYDGKYYLPDEEVGMLEDICSRLSVDTASTPEEINGHLCVDLGLSVLWASCNMGAQTPCASGDTYAWGEVIPRNDGFKKESYAFCAMQGGILCNTKYNDRDKLITLDTTDDAAISSWGAPWRMPTRTEFAELIDNCVFTFLNRPLGAFGGHHVKGWVVTSKINRNSIFLPVTGIKADWGEGCEPSQEDQESVLLWSSTHSPYWKGCVSLESDAYILDINTELLSIENDIPLCRRYNGLCIRPVADIAPKVHTRRVTFRDRIVKIRDKKDVFINYLKEDQDAFRDVFLMIDRVSDLKAISSCEDNANEDKEDAAVALRQCRVAIFILSEQSISSKEARKRVHYALERGKVVIPVWTENEVPHGWLNFEFGPQGFIRLQDEGDKSYLENLLREMFELSYPSMLPPGLYNSPIGDFSEGLAPFYESGKWGYRDMCGKTVISPKYVIVSSFKEGLAIAAIGRRFGFIDWEEQYVVECNGYSGASLFSEGLSGVNLDDKFGFIDTRGKMVISPVWGHAEPFFEGRALVRTADNWKWGYIDNSGLIVIQPQYSEAESFREGLAAVEDENQLWGFIDKDGRTVIEHQFSRAYSFSEGKAYVVGSDGVPMFIDKEGKRCFDTKINHKYLLRYRSAFRDGRALVADENHEDWYIDENGVFIENPDECEGFEPFSEGMAVVINKYNKAGFIDRSGRLVIDSIYDGARSFHEGVAAVRKGEYYFYIDRNGKEVLHHGRVL